MRGFEYTLGQVIARVQWGSGVPNDLWTANSLTHEHIAQAAREQTSWNLSAKGLVIAGLVAALYGPLLTQMVVNGGKTRTTVRVCRTSFVVTWCTAQARVAGRFRLSPATGFPVMLARSCSCSRGP